MHQITIQKLATIIPRTVECWSVDDVCTWLNLNEVQIDTNKIKQLNLDGITMMKINPNQLIKIGATKFMARRIVQWLEEDASQFNQFLYCHADDIRPHALSLHCEVESICKEEGISKQIVNEKCNNSNKNDYFLQKPKSQQNLPDQLPAKKRKISFNEGKPIQNSNEIQLQNGTESISELQSSLSSNEDQDEITSLKNQGQSLSDNQSQLKKIKLERVISDNCEVTDRLQRKNGNMGVYNGNKANKGEGKQRKLQSQQNQQSKIKSSDVEDMSIVENESMNVAKWLKKKKDDSKAFNYRLKTKSKELNIKNPKLYNYLSSAHIGQTSETSTNQNPSNKVGNFKKVASVQQIPNIRRMNMQLSSQQRKDKSNENILIVSQIMENPNVKFVSSQFMPYNPHHILNQNHKHSNIMLKPNMESFLRMVKPNFQKIITGMTHAKVGRFTQNQFVLDDQDVSRTHAQIIPQLQDNGTCSYCIRDLGSKFGTFVECRAIQTDIVGKSYLIGDAQIQILSLQPSKHPTKRQTFDLKIRIDNQKQLSLLNRSSVSIGKKLRNDIKIEQNCTNARIWTEKGKFYIEGIEDKIFVKLKQQEVWDINAYVDMNSNSNSGKVQIVFGCCRVEVEVGLMCFVCRGTDCGCLG